MKKALFAGSFDPITLAHLDIIDKSKNICDYLIIAIAKNARKTSSLFTDLEKKEMIESATKHLSWTSSIILDDLTASYAKKNEVLPTFLWVKLKTTTMKVNRYLKILPISKSTGHSFNFLNFRV